MAGGLDAIGHTPLVRLRSFEADGGGEVWVKWEGANPTRNIEDRMAAGMVAHGEETGALRPGMRVVEYTGGSTGSSLAMVCAARGYRAHFVTADCFAVEKIRTMRAFGAEVEVLESDGGKVTPELFDRFKARIAELAAEPDTWWAEQFVNPGNARAYGALAQELVDELGDGIDGFVTGIGTWATFLGVAAVLKEPEPIDRVHRDRACDVAKPFGRPGSAGTGWRGSGSGSFPPLPGSTSPTRSPPSPTTTRSRRRVRWPGTRDSSRADLRRQRPRRSPARRGARARAAGRDDPDRLGPQVPRRGPVREPDPDAYGRPAPGAGGAAIVRTRPVGSPPALLGGPCQSAATMNSVRRSGPPSTQAKQPRSS